MLAYFFAPAPDSNGDGPRGFRDPDSSAVSTHSDSKLLEAIRSSEIVVAERAFSDMIHQNSAVLYAYTLSFINEPDYARDIVQDCFADIWMRREELNPSGSFQRYLLGSVRFKALHFLRRRRLEGKHLVERDLSTLPVSSPNASIDEVIEHADLYAAVIRVAQSLPPRSGRVFALRWGEGLPYAEIARRLGISVKGVEIQITRALKFIRERLEKGSE